MFRVLSGLLGAFFAAPAIAVLPGALASYHGLDQDVIAGFVCLALAMLFVRYARAKPAGLTGRCG